MMKRRPVLAALLAPLLALGGPASAADKTLTVGAAVFPDSLRSGTSSFASLSLMTQTNDLLVARDNKGDLHPALALSWETIDPLTVRFHLRLRSRELPFPEPGCSLEPRAADSMDDQSFWNSIQSMLPDEREKRLAYLLYHCGLKPREIVLRCPGEFDDVKDIYRLNHNIVERLRRNSDRLRHVLGGDE